MFLSRFIGTKEKENLSYSRASEVNLWITLITILCCVLEILLYFFFNRQVTTSTYHLVLWLLKIFGDLLKTLVIMIINFLNIRSIHGEISSKNKRRLSRSPSSPRRTFLSDRSR